MQWPDIKSLDLTGELIFYATIKCLVSICISLIYYKQNDIHKILWLY